MDRKQIVLRENWKFCLEVQTGEEQPGTESEYPHEEVWGAWYKGYDDSGWRDVVLPHDWSVEQPFSRRNSSGTGYLAGGIGWYRVHFALPEAYRGKSVKVVFDGVYKNSQVWCNSYYLGRRPYGYTTFSYDISHAAVFGDGENVLTVKVVHTDLADSRWFTGSGITRKVTVVVEEPVHPAEHGVFFRVKQVEPEDGSTSRESGRAELLITHWTEVSEEQARSAGMGEDIRVHIRTALEDETGKEVITLEGQTVPGGECTLAGTLEQAKLWSPERPYLYTMRTWYAISEGKEAEYYLADEQAVGIRRIEFHPQKGFFLNGVETKLKGVCVHHDGGALGAAMRAEIWQRRLAALKECGCNAIRCSHNPHMPELYELCDRMGFFVMDEAFDEWENAKNKWSRGHNVYPPVHQGYFEEFQGWHEADLCAMVRRDRNHASVILWSIGNEIDYPNDPYCYPSFASMTGNNDAGKPEAERQYDSAKPNAMRLVAVAGRLERIVRREDDTRPVTLASAYPELSAETGLFGGLDVVGYNYKEHLYQADHARLPGKPLLGSENGHGYGAWLAVRDQPYISGQFLWTGIDYLGEARGWPVHGSPAGILTCAGMRKPEFYRRKTFWRREPLIAIATRRVSDGPEPWRPMESHWNYEEGEEVLVKIYSNLPRVRLLLEDAQDMGIGRELWGVSRQELGRLEGYNGDGEYCFRVHFQQGTLIAEGYAEKESGAAEAVPAAVCSIASTGHAVRLDYSLWRQPDLLTGRTWEEAAAEQGYLYQLELGLKDAQDQPVSWQEKVLSVAVSGAGELAGLESGNLADVTPYSENRRATFHGRLSAFIRRRAAGEIRLEVSAEDMESPVFLTIQDSTSSLL